ncbi:DUF6591 domain-containing protein [Paratractidigestivibacter sp.]|uniref:DUF6591 domain-containing protein n=1 Tax=Paratractidigestivibacter sp. TaxID=2847316 RepID=UPI002AC922AD|nr:DUF6591 domain-containing protein [Paratractidigestivibacter sp.]
MDTSCLKATVAVVLTVLIGGCSSTSGQASSSGGAASASIQAEQAQNDWWPTNGLATKVPVPASSTGEVVSDGDTYFQAEVHDSGKDDYESYVEKCKEAGFTVDAEKNGINFQGWNEEGYELNVNMWESDNLFKVSIESPRELTELTWPTVGPASVVPAPESTMGKTDVNTSDRYCVWIGNTPIKSYSAYVDKLMSAGFNVDYSRSEKWFKAKNAEGYDILAEYLGYDTMYIWVDVPEE